MTSVGSILREARESLGRSLPEIAQELCLTRQYVIAIEDNNVTGVPGLFFYKSFARQYAALVGVDERLIRTALDAIAEPTDAVPHPDIRVPDRLVQATNRRDIPDVSMGWSVAGLILVLLLGSVFYAWWKRAPQSQAAAPAVEATAPVVAITAAEHSPRELAQPNPAPAERASDIGGVVLKLSATERTWLSISSGGKEIFAGILQPSESKTLTGLERATMKVGNAGGIQVLWNGKVISPLGTRGQVLTSRITPEDFEIVPPKQEL